MCEINTLEVGVELVRHLPEPFDKETSVKLIEIADFDYLPANFDIAETKFTLIKNQQI